MFPPRTTCYIKDLKPYCHLGSHQSLFLLGSVFFQEKLGDLAGFTKFHGQQRLSEPEFDDPSWVLRGTGPLRSTRIHLESMWAQVGRRKQSDPSTRRLRLCGTDGGVAGIGRGERGEWGEGAGIEGQGHRVMFHQSVTSQQSTVTSRFESTPKTQTLSMGFWRFQAAVQPFSLLERSRS